MPRWTFWSRFCKAAKEIIEKYQVKSLQNVAFFACLPGNNYVIAMYTTVNLVIFRPNRTSSACDTTYKADIRSLKHFAPMLCQLFSVLSLIQSVQSNASVVPKSRDT